MIKIEHLTKKYGDRVAVDDLNLTIEPGRIYGFLGPNGAGKSTTMNIITGYLAATEGTVTINGHDSVKEAVKAKSCIGYLPEIPPLYPDMTVLEYLTFVAELKGIDKKKRDEAVDEACITTGISDVAGRLIRNLSKGYKQRVGLAQAIMGGPDVIILDEPTVGLDPAQIIEIRNLITEFGKERTVILSSHILSEISATCSYVFIISKGRLVAADETEALLKRMKGSQEVEVTFEGSGTGKTGTHGMTEGPGAENAVSSGMKEGSDAVQAAIHGMTEDELSGMLSAIPGVERTESLGTNENGERRFRLHAEPEADVRPDVFGFAVKNGLTMLEMKTQSRSLEDVFLELTSEDAAADAASSGGSGTAERTAEDEAASGEAATGETEPSDSASGEAASGETEPSDSAAEGTEPSDSASGETEPADAAPEGGEE